MTTVEPVTTVEGDDLIIQLEQTDIDARIKKMPKKSLRTLLGKTKKNIEYSIIIYLDFR